MLARNNEKVVEMVNQIDALSESLKKKDIIVASLEVKLNVSNVPKTEHKIIDSDSEKYHSN